MKTSISWLWKHRQYIPTKTLLKVIAIARINALSSKLKYLSTVSTSKKKGQQVSVVHYDPADPENTVFPENMNERGCLLVPKCLTEQQWIEIFGK